MILKFELNLTLISYTNIFLLQTYIFEGISIFLNQ